MIRNGKEDKGMLIKVSKILKKEQKIRANPHSCKIKNLATTK